MGLTQDVSTGGGSGRGGLHPGENVRLVARSRLQIKGRLGGGLVEGTQDRGGGRVEDGQDHENRGLVRNPLYPDVTTCDHLIHL